MDSSVNSRIPDAWKVDSAAVEFSDDMKLIFGKEQDYEINGTNATYTQTDDLTEELTFSINLDFNKKISNSGTFAFGFDAFHSTQETSSFQGNINYTSKF